ncbi:hypothetical protein ACFFUT_09135 [Pseudohalocynthiibacter aestuariivivens]|uniref:Uncharacterized protein n=1 Tax=Pseudohalocynthiibacter aestuariivivens TaxID=1591409 RepID=A0ABV5JEQ1_9RHOB|nr:hypothetical protein [Pseudohalocynthiibacter aestuariivivens]MBS9718496.1 hypothetical protein [Pseudohalocynthiibacter aestuariivivens]
MTEANATLIDGQVSEADHRIAAYAIYCVTHKQFSLGNISLKRANNIVGNMLAATPFGWRVVGITPSALSLFHDSNFRVRPKGIQRAHIFNRIDTVKELLNCDIPVEPEELFRTWELRDKTILCLNKENRRISEHKHFKIANPNGLHFTNAYIGYSYSPQRDGQFLRELWEKHSAS